MNRTQTSGNSDIDSDENLEESDACCGAPHCIKPVGRINWFQCGKCNTWCHYDCVGISNLKRFDRHEEYLCPSCSGNTFEGFSNQNLDSENLETFTPVASTSGQSSEPGQVNRPKRRAKEKSSSNVKNLILTNQL